MNIVPREKSSVCSITNILTVSAKVVVLASGISLIGIGIGTHFYTDWGLKALVAFELGGSAATASVIFYQLWVWLSDRKEVIYVTTVQKEHRPDVIEPLPPRARPRSIFAAIENGGLEEAEFIALLENTDANAPNRNRETPLQCAVRHQKVTYLRALLGRGANFDIVDIEGNRPVHLAYIHYGLASNEIVSMLKEKGANINAPGKGGNTPLHLAKNQEAFAFLCGLGADREIENALGEKPGQMASALKEALEEKNIDKVRQALDRGANPNWKAGERTPLKIAVDNKNTAIVQLLIQRGAKASENSSLVGLAVIQGCYDIVELLLRNGASVNQRNADSLELPIHDILRIEGTENRKRMLDLLLQYGADINAKGKIGNTLLHYLYVEKEELDQKFVDYIKTKPNVNAKATNDLGETPGAPSPEMLKALKANDIKTVRGLLLKGANPNAKHKEDKPSLYYGVKHNNLAMVKMFLEFGAKPDVECPYGTPLHHAVLQGNASIASLLVGEGKANVNARNYANEQPIHLLRQSSANWKLILQLLVSSGADVNAKDYKGNTLLHILYLKKKKNQDLIAYLENEYEADTTIQNDNGETPRGLSPVLRTAILKSSILGVETALKNLKANPNGQDEYGNTPLSLALDNKEIVIARYLIKKGADVDQTTQVDPLLHRAIATKNEEAFLLLLKKGANVCIKSPKDNSEPIHALIEVKDHALRFKWLLELEKHGADVTAQDKSGDTLLHMLYQEEERDQNSIDYLEAKQGRILNALGEAPGEISEEFAEAIIANNYSKVMSLLRQGANSNGKAKGKDALTLALEPPKTMIIKYLIRRGAKSTIEHLKVVMDQDGLIGFDTLVLMGVDLNQKDDKGNTPLHFAAEKGRTDIVQALLEEDAKIAEQNSDGLTPLQLAKTNNNHAVVALLIKHGAIDESCNAALFEAIQGKDEEQAAKALQEGADPNARDEFGSTALHRAASAGMDGLVTLLTARKADLNATIALSGRTPLHLACVFLHHDVVRILLENGADPKARDKFKQTPFHALFTIKEALTPEQDKARAAILSELVVRWAGMDEEDKDGNTPRKLLLARAPKSGNKNN